MKCRHWRHFANDCNVATNTCSMCGGEHRTNECSNRERAFCVSCKSNEHPSWDRDCPEFHRRCEQYDENYLENNLLYFPMGEDWTLTPCPCKLQRNKKFPVQYVVSPYHHPKQSNHMLASKPIGKQCKQQTKVPENQCTMDCYIDHGNLQRMDSGTIPPPENADAAATSGLDFNSFPYPNDISRSPLEWD